MTKPTVSRLFYGSLIAIAGGIIGLLIASALGFAGTGFIMNGPDVIAVQPSSVTWVAMSIGVASIVAIVGGGFGQLVAWIGALVNTAPMQDKTWFIVLLVLGIVGVGFIPMLVYVLAGPDGTLPATPAAPTQPTSAPTTV